MPPFSGSAIGHLHQAVGMWTLDGPTTAGFNVANFGLKRVSGTIPVTSAYFEVGQDGSVRGVSAVLDIASIDTGQVKRDSDLAKPGLLDLDHHPQLTFRGTRVVPLEHRWAVDGLLTAKGTTREISLQVTAEEQVEGAVRLRLTGQLDRRHYGIRAPRFLIGALVDIEIEATFSR
jgi:polyisoprenoid-binding protein YceI